MNEQPLDFVHGVTANLNVDVEAIELGTRQNEQFKSYFFLDTDQLKNGLSYIK